MGNLFSTTGMALYENSIEEKYKENIYIRVIKNLLTPSQAAMELNISEEEFASRLEDYIEHADLT